MGIIGRLFRRASGGAAARKAELAGDLVGAIRLWVDAGSVNEAARVMILRGDAAPDPETRLQHYTQAAATATAGSEPSRTARVKKAKLTAALAAEGALSVARRRDVVEAAEALEEAGELRAAAEAYALGGDTDGEARVLASGGEIERLENLLSDEQARASDGRLARDVHAEIDALVLAGRRREALALADASPNDPLASSRATRIRGALVRGPVVRMTVLGERVVAALGAEVTLGRADATIHVASNALSRHHARFARDGGRFFIEDLGSRNGTQLRGLSIAHRLDIVDGVSLTLGGEVPLRVEPSTALQGSLAIEVAGERYVAPLGIAKLGVGSWRLVVAGDGWVELETDATSEAFAGEVLVAPRVTLLRGDAFARERGGEVVLTIEEGALAPLHRA